MGLRGAHSRFVPALIVLGVLLTFFPTHLAAQTLSGRVLGLNDQPLPDAGVEIWGRAVVLDVLRTDPAGRFTLPDPTTLDAEVTRYVFRYLGHATAIIQRDDFVDGMDVRLAEEAAFVLEGIDVTVDREACPQVDQPDARALWARAAESYSRTTSRYGMRARYRADMRDVSEERLFAGRDGPIDANTAFGTSWTSGQMRVAGRIMVLEDLVMVRGYAWERVLTGPQYGLGRDRHLNWEYAELDTRSANHFATYIFGELHTFTIQSETARGCRLRFCPLDRGGDPPTIRGTVLVGRDRTLVEAEWRFLTDDPLEDAGGWVRFDTVEDPSGGRPHLVAARSLFHRHNGFEKRYANAPRWVFRDLREWSGWAVSRNAMPPAASGANRSPH